MKQKLLILGASGMIGHKLFDALSKQPNLVVWATVRSSEKFTKLFGPKLISHIVSNIDANDFAAISNLLKDIKPDVIINCIGITKQLVKENDPLEAIEINSVFPHRLASLCKEFDIRMIQFTTDCVFNGQKGNYKETDPSDATDLYGRSKYLGEVYYPHCLSIRTSFIGHELGTDYGLLEWFLSQKNVVTGYQCARYSGIPTVLIASILTQYILPNSKLHGLYHISTDPISKYDLLQLFAKSYNKKINIIKDDTVKIDRSLNSERFQQETEYNPLPWEEMIETMHDDFISSDYYTIILKRKKSKKE